MDLAAYVDDLRARASAPGDASFAAKQLLVLHDAALQRPGGVFLELGTDRGQATRAILAACEQNGGSLVSIDIRDCSDAAQNPAWTFVQADSADWNTVTARAPFLGDGIDFVYVDSLHTPEQVTAEIYGWYPFLKDGGIVFVDDVDSGPYLKGARKDSAKMELESRLIRNLMEEIFYANRDVLDLSILYGSTGLAVLDKRAPIGTALKPARRIRPRNSMFIARTKERLGIGYRNRRDGSDYLLGGD